MSSAVPLSELARLIRSKNAGPYWLTIDVMFDDTASYRRVLDSGWMTPARMAALLRQDVGDVIVTAIENALAVKVSFPRRYSAGSPRDSDVLGGQQYAALLDLPIP